MSKLKKYQILYDTSFNQIEPGSNVPSSNNYFECKFVSDGKYGNLSVNPNLVRILFKGISKQYILSTGHSIGPHACKINGNDIELDTLLLNTIINSGKYYTINNTKFDMDFSLISHDTINNIPRVVSFPGKFDNLVIPVSGIDVEPNKSKSYYKYGKTTGVTSANIFLMLQKPKAKHILASCKIKSGKINIYEIPNYSDSSYTVIQVSSNGVDDNIVNKDFLLAHDENFYDNTYFNDSLNIEPNYQLYIYLTGFIEYLGYEPNTLNKKELFDIIKTNNIGNIWFDSHRIGWVSLMGDSGAGFYSIELDERGNQTAKLLGINIEGCSMIKVVKLKSPRLITEKIFINWNCENSKLIIGNYEIISAQKCSLVHSISHIEHMMRDITKEYIQVN